MSAWLHGEAGSPSRTGQIRPVAGVFVFLDEDQDSIDDGYFVVRYPDDTSWRNMPSSRHDQGANITFADGHCERWSWKAPKVYNNGGSASGAADLADLRRRQGALPALQ